MRHVYTLAAVGAEMMRIARLMNLHWEWLLVLMGGDWEVIPIVVVEPEDSDFEGNLDVVT